MINNRQNGRRRGRGGPQVRNGSGNGPERGNRIDSRARGNAAQLHEKYRNLARDAQTQGDRVMTEYYLQFADHYFRVLSEGRTRFEEQNPNQQGQQRRPLSSDDFDEGFEGEIGDEGGEPEVAPRRDREPRRELSYEDRDQPEREPRGQSGGDTGYARDNQQGRESQQGRDGNQQGRDYREGQRERGNRDQYNRDNRNGQQLRDNRPATSDRPASDRPASDREEQRPPREAYQPRETPPPEPAAMQPAPTPTPAEAEVARPRRGRPPRRPEAIAASGEAPAQIEIDRLPPAFAPVEPVAAPLRARRKSVEAVPEGAVLAVEGEPAEPAPRRRRARRDAGDDNVAA